MKWLKFVRTFKEGIYNFLRNGSLTFVTVTVLTVSLYAMSATLMFLYIASMFLVEAQDRVNVSVYLKSSTEESKIMEIKDKLGEFEGVKYVRYKSKEEAFEELKTIAETDESIQSALEEIEWENPLNPALIVGAQNPTQYDSIIEKINNSFFSEDIYNINFDDNKDDIERISNVLKMTKEAGLIIGVVFILIGILITFNTVKLTIYSHKQEFEVMRLVGASNLYIRMPFIFEGLFYGLVSGLIVMILLFGTAYFMAPLTNENVPQGNALNIYLQNFFLIFAGVFGSGILLGAISSFIAIRKYLKI